jgi:tripartite-type tricarboxylate transporter receptor subunit TctC
MITRRIVFAASIAAGLAIASSSAYAQPYPDRPIKLILPFTPGSPNGVLARLVIPSISAQLGQTIVIEPRPGGGTSIGTKAVMSAEADGYTLLFSNTPTLLIVPVASKSIHYDALKDIVPVATVASGSNVMVIAPDLPVKTVKDFIAHAKANPGKLNFGYGQGTQPQLIGEMFKAITDMMGGRIHINIGTLSTLKPLHESGKVRAIAVTSTERSPLLPEIPTMAESGLPSVTSLTYFGIFGPPGLPASVVNRINAAVNESLKSAELRAAMEKLGFTPRPMSPRAFAELVAAENKKWVPIVKATGFQM